MMEYIGRYVQHTHSRFLDKKNIEPRGGSLDDQASLVFQSIYQDWSPFVDGLKH